jgi:hypothetical protein
VLYSNHIFNQKRKKQNQSCRCDALVKKQLVVCINYRVKTK